jgi:sugar phosphate isomerase/epimerase
MRLGGPVFNSLRSPDEWVRSLLRRGYRAAYCPVTTHDDHATVQEYLQAAKQADIVIAEVGAWSNPLSPDDQTRADAVRYCQEQLALADEVGARCCVNITGSRGDLWDGPHPDNLTRETFDCVVETVRTIIDAVRPTRTYYALEIMPWAFPNTTGSYLSLIRAINRPRFAVHFDAVNLISSPQLYFQNTTVIRDFVGRLGSYIQSCHARDVVLRNELPLQLCEVRPGLGGLDYASLLKSINRVNEDIPLLLEHLESEEEYRLAGSYILTINSQTQVSISQQ